LGLDKFNEEEKKDQAKIRENFAKGPGCERATIM